MVGRPALTVVPGGMAEPIEGRTVWLILDDRSLDPAVAACAARATDLAAGMDAALRDRFGAGAGDRHGAMQGSLPEAIAFPPLVAVTFHYGTRDVAAVMVSSLVGNDLRGLVTETFFGLRPGTCAAPSACGL
ncbi:hypothetical protein [Rubellimicrobium roseum]|uniref:Uncharacterized protein n=1 Tax=Rubellimicrobium roseum TaxID=687525 RepID=A0A5C4NLT5_9RHOB|nr:hypothetical protein [Rubellimicrobium roseum]TNC74086.1 hypothetical protein FHG71_02480 [Rubellimicrobium roseum]